MSIADGRRIGLLAIHGIGEQAPGQTKDQVVAALKQAYPDAPESGGAFDLPHCQVRVYEVYWTPVLSGEAVDGSFDIKSVQQLIWFPWLNHRRFPAYRNLYPRRLVWSWTAVLIPLGVLVTAAYYGLIWLMTMTAGFRQAFTEAGRERRKSGRSRFHSAKAEARERTGNRVLDRIGADVINYVNAAVGAPAPVPDAEQRIYECLENVLREAIRDECTEIQILAHSLGSLIAYRALTVQHGRLSQLVQVPFDGDGRGLPPLTRFFTIGSPLEKVRFFWPRLLRADPGADDADSRLGWHNFKSRLDLVASLVTRDAGLSRRIENHTVKGVGGLMRAHTAYLRTPAFLSVFGFELTGEEIKATTCRRNAFRFLRQIILETVPLPIVLLGLAAAGVLVMLGTGAGSGFILALPVRWIGEGLRRAVNADWEVHRAAADWIPQFFTWLFPAVLLGLAVPIGYKEASEMHEKHWGLKDEVSKEAIAEGGGATAPIDSVERRTAMSGSDVSKSDVSRQEAPRRVWHFVGSIVLLVAIAWLGLRFQPREQAWLIVLVLMTVFAFLNGHGISGVRWGILIDSRRKISLSRLQMLAWTLIVLSALLTAILSNVSSGSDSPMDIQIPTQLWILLGISTATAVGAPTLLNAKRSKQADNRELGKTAKELTAQGHKGPDTEEGSVVLRNASIRDARWSEVLKGDESGNASTVDLGKLQMFFFTFILACGYAAAMYAMFARRGAITGLPPVQEGMNVLLGISQTGYLASKAVTISKEQPEAAPPPAPAAEGPTPPTPGAQVVAAGQS